MKNTQLKSNISTLLSGKKTRTLGALGAALLIASVSVPVSANADPFLGEISVTGANYCPRGTTEAAGQLLPINQNQALFSLLGTTFGGDGRTTFALPDYRGRTPIGYDFNNFPLGSKLGQETVTLNPSQIPNHTHTAATTTTVHATSASGRTASPDNAVLANDGADRVYTTLAENAPTTATLADGAITSTTTVSASNNLPINNMHPYLVMKVCIATQGLFPSRN